MPQYEITFQLDDNNIYLPPQKQVFEAPTQVDACQQCLDEHPRCHIVEVNRLIR